MTCYQTFCGINWTTWTSNKCGGATHLVVREIIDLLRQRFPDRVISRNANVNCPPRSCDLRPCDFSSGVLQCANEPQTVADLTTEIHHVIIEIEPTDLKKNLIKKVKLYSTAIINFNTSSL